jgi:hypothetical protein
LLGGHAVPVTHRAGMPLWTVQAKRRGGQ